MFRITNSSIKRQHAYNKRGGPNSPSSYSVSTSSCMLITFVFIGIFNICVVHILHPTTDPDLSLLPFNRSILTQQHIDQFAEIHVSSYDTDKFQNVTKWCSEIVKATHPTGLLFVRLPKAASSTLGGVVLQIAKRYNCSRMVGHKSGNDAGEPYGWRDKEHSFLFSNMRNPATRSVSRCFFTHVSAFNRTPTDDNILNCLAYERGMQTGAVSLGKGGFQLAYMSLPEIPEYSAWSDDAPDRVRNPDVVESNVLGVMQDYDFIMLMERLDESLVAMKIILGLTDVRDILYVGVPKSVGGGSYYYMKKRDKCVSISKSFVTPRVKEYLKSDEWLAANYGDYLLYALANKVLDKTIEKIGPALFQKELQIYRDAQKNVTDKCSNHVQFPCDANGTAQVELSEKSCLLEDMGCGYNCYIGDPIQVKRLPKKYVNTKVKAFKTRTNSFVSNVHKYFFSTTAEARKRKRKARNGGDAIRGGKLLAATKRKMMQS